MSVNADFSIAVRRVEREKSKLVTLFHNITLGKLNFAKLQIKRFPSD